MKLALFTVLLIAISAAQFEDFDSQISDCQRMCCVSQNGSWDGFGGCEGISGDPLITFQACSNACLEEAGGTVGGAGYDTGNVCCAPGSAIFCLAGAVFANKKHKMTLL